MRRLIVLFAVLAFGLAVVPSALAEATCRQCYPSEASTEGGDQDGVLVRETFQITQNQYPVASDVHFVLWQKEQNVHIKGWRVCIDRFDEAMSCLVEGEHEVMVKVWCADDACIPAGMVINVYCCFWLDNFNTKRIKNIQWSSRRLPDWGWIIDYPEIGPGDQYTHRVEIGNDNLDGSDMTLLQLWLLPDENDYDNLDDVPFGDGLLSEAVTISVDLPFEFDVLTVDDFIGHHIYGKAIVEDPSTHWQMTDIFDHPVTAAPVDGVEDLGERPANATLILLPNPFLRELTVEYRLESAASNLKLLIYDVGGRLVDTIEQGRKEPGEYSLTWNAGETAKGVYLVRLVLDGKILTSKSVKLE
jgi:hypothetical protein